MIGQFNGLYFTVRPTKFKILFELKSSPSITSIRTQRYLNYLTNLFFFVVPISYGISFFPLGFRGPRLITVSLCKKGDKRKRCMDMLNFHSILSPYAKYLLSGLLTQLKKAILSLTQKKINSYAE